MEEKVVKLFNELRPVAKKQHDRIERERKSGQLYNVFSVMSVFGDDDTAETQHSKFLGDLLNPRGNHGCGMEFLDLFLQMAKIGNLKFDPDYEYRNIIERSLGNTTEEGKNSKGGRIDIIIEDGKNALIIENKIYAVDRPNQLIRYENYAKQFSNYYIVYLSRDGHEPSEGSAGSDRIDNLICLSYRDHILSWLEQCIAIANVPVGETIKQYRNIIRSLTNQTTGIAYKQDLINIVQNNLQETILLLQNSEAIQQKFIKKYVTNPLREYVINQGWKIDIKEYDPKELRPKNLCWFKILPTGWNIHSIYYQFETNLQYIGINGGKDRKDIEKEEKLSCLQSCNKKKDNRMGWTCVEDLTKPASLTAIVAGDVCRKLCDLIAEMVSQAENQANEKGFQI